MNTKTGSKSELIIEEIKRVAEVLGKQRFTREEFINNSQLPITRTDIENAFSSFASAMKSAGLRPQKHYKVSDEDLFKAYNQASNKLGYLPLGHKGEEELTKLTSISGFVFRKRFGGLKNFLFEFKNWQLENSSKEVTVSTDEPLKVNTELKPLSIDVRTEYIENKRRYSGKAAENLVVAELLFKGFNAQILQVDEGIDVFAINVRKNELYLIQVKYTYYENPTRSGAIEITISTFEKNKKSNVYYIFVLERGVNKRDFLILPFHKVDELMKNRSINKVEDSKQVSFRVLHKGEEDAFINKVSELTEVSRFLNAWDVLL